jgi:hypothetical protein
MSKTPVEQTELNCACVIHGDMYDWSYVDRLYSMLKRNFSVPIKFHVFTELGRDVPDHMIKHVLTDWPGVGGKKKGWWYKMQMFDPGHIQGQVLYFDLDVVITGNLDWVLTLDSEQFWTIRDFKYLWRPQWQGINSSMMYWNTLKFGKIWHNFQGRQIAAVMREFHGDQDFLTATIPGHLVKFVDHQLIKSWRWQVKDGGMDMRTRIYRSPNTGSIIDPTTKVVVFHGSPKPHEINDPAILKHWM